MINSVAIVSFVILAIVFGKWWIYLFAVLFLHYTSDRKDGVSDETDDQPTAYDIDKIVEQLEERSGDEIELWATEEINYDSKGDLIIRRTTDLHDYGMRCYQNAIEIVKSGGKV